MDHLTFPFGSCGILALFLVINATAIGTARWIRRSRARPPARDTVSRRKRPLSMNLAVRPEVTETASIQDNFSHFAESHGVGVKPVLDVNMAILETFQAFINHGENLSIRHVVVAFTIAKNDLYFTIAATGPPFRLKGASAMPAGMGKELCQGYMDDIRYEYRHGQNRLVARKHYDIS